MEIYKYNLNAKWWRDLVNNVPNTSKNKKVYENCIRENAQKVSLQEYFGDTNRNDIFKKYSYMCFGEAKNCLERLANGEINYDNDLSYCSAKERFPEDLREDRTDWDEMKSYADGLYYFIEDLKSAIASGEVKICENGEE